MDYERLPSTWVIEEARAFLRAAQILEQGASNGDFHLYWPAVMNSALASELLLKSFLVEADPRFPRFGRRLARKQAWPDGSVQRYSY